jgi:Tol biopolymer transport system component
MVGWTQNGSSILFVSDRSGTRDLYLLGIENGRPRGNPELLRHNLVANTNLLLTRDGRLFQLENTGTTNAYISPFDETTGKVTGTQSLVDQNYPRAAFPEWSPDGKLLYYEIFKEPLNEQLLFIRSEETGETREIALKPKLSYWYRPILSPDGKRFAVTGTGENMDFGIFAIDLESGEVSQIARIPVENNPVDPSQNWSPDGKAIFYKVRSFEQSEEFIIRRKDLTTGEEKDIYRGMHTRDMKISSDGTRFVYFRNDRPTKSYVLGILDLKSGKESELWRVPEADSPEISGPTWAPDGKHILVAKSLKQGSELWRFPVAGGPGEKLYSNPESTWGFVMHPSGKRMAFTQSRTNYELWVLENFLPK